MRLNDIPEAFWKPFITYLNRTLLLVLAGTAIGLIAYAKWGQTSQERTAVTETEQRKPLDSESSETEAENRVIRLAKTREELAATLQELSCRAKRYEGHVTRAAVLETRLVESKEGQQ